MTSFLYENCHSDRFQDFAQALLLPEYPGLQCFPVGESDGGRDATQLLDGFKTILQVKHKRYDDTLRDPAAWVISSLEKELPKIQALAKAGASRYVIVTNARGSAKPELGHMDRVQEWLDTNLGIPGQCLWRQDLDRRFERSGSFKLSYPELLTGADALHLIIESAFSTEGQRRALCLKSFTAKRLDQEAKVKFKQVDLVNDLFSLFVDVPLKAQEGMLRVIPQASGELTVRYFDAKTAVAQRYAGRQGPHMSAPGASALLSPNLHMTLTRIVIEGGPGQGKSTLLQYVAQVYRMRFLQKEALLQKRPAEHRIGPVRIPFKVDLRDFATWLDRKNPFDPEDPAPLNSWHPDLEAFMAHMVQTQSGGLAFTTGDLLATMDAVPCIMLFDGLDEIADIEMRRSVVALIEGALSSWSLQAFDIQAVITSRPAAFVNSPGFSGSDYQHFALEDVPTEKALEYTEHWILAKKLEDEDAAELRKVFRNKIREPHVRDLARNPMQLAILLNLMNEVGDSLPPMRTDLYETYMDRFLNREADKSRAVKKYRKVLEQIHEYLAWVIHCNVEGGRSSGSVTNDELRSHVSTFLATKGHRSEIIDELFTGAIERVYVLVARVEGTYEFEVQPLREFFAASYLYKTAPVSRPGSVMPGTISERFTTLAGSRYWTNVTRFYCGFYTSGEVADLSIHLRDIKNRGTEVEAIHARYLGACLLGDWVFNISPLVQNEVAEQVFDNEGLRWAFRGFGEAASQRSGIINISQECGGYYLGERSLSRLQEQPVPAVREEFTRLLAANSFDGLDERLLKLAAESSGARRTQWFDIAAATRSFSPNLQDKWLDLVESDSPNEVARADRGLYLVPALLKEGRRQKELELTVMRSVYEGVTFSDNLALTSNAYWSNLLAALAPAHSYYGGNAIKVEDWGGELPISQLIDELITTDKGFDLLYGEHAKQGEWAEHLRSAFGEGWGAYAWGALSARSANTTSRGKGAGILFDTTKSVSSRARNARFRRTQSDWWLRQRNDIESRADRMFWILLVCSWNKVWPRQLLDALDAELASLSSRQYESVLSVMTWQFTDQGTNFGISGAKLEGRSARLLGLNTVVSSPKEPLPVAHRTIMDCSDDAIVQNICATWYWNSTGPTVRSLQDWHAFTSTMKKYLVEGAIQPGNFLYFMDELKPAGPMPRSLAELVLADPESYPSPLLDYALSICRSNTLNIRVGDAAASQGWVYR